MSELVINKLDDIIAQQLTSDEEIIKTEIINLLAPGENYLSEMLKIHVILKNRVTEAEREINAVAKCAAESTEINEFLKLFTPTLFLKEITFYKDMVPAIQGFLKNKGMSPADYYPEYYGARLNLSGDSKPDKDAILILENLQTAGYQNMDRHEGFDLEAAKAVVKDLAHFHAVPVAMKLLEPELFQDRIKKTCDIEYPEPPKSPNDEKPNDPTMITEEVLLDILREDQACLEIIPSVQNMLKERNNGDVYKPKATEPFATIAHADMWMNNTMQKLDSKGTPIKNKFVDFQWFHYNSPAFDLIFLLMTSVQTSVLRTHLDYLMKYYHDYFVGTLNELGCDISPFSYDNFLLEVKSMTSRVIIQGSFMLLMIVFGKKGESADVNQACKLIKDDFDPKAREQFRFIVHEAYKRGWLM